jgi:hypothetical protein
MAETRHPPTQDPTELPGGATPGRPKESGSRQQTHPDQSSLSGSPTLRAGHRIVLAGQGRHCRGPTTPRARTIPRSQTRVPARSLAGLACVTGADKREAGRIEEFSRMETTSFGPLDPLCEPCAAANIAVHGDRSTPHFENRKSIQVRFDYFDKFRPGCLLCAKTQLRGGNHGHVERLAVFLALLNPVPLVCA